MTILLSIYVFSISQLLAQNAQRQCGEPTAVFDQQKTEALATFTQNWLKNKDQKAISRGKIIIPVVVHIVYQSEAENISDEQVWSQIAALNRDFNLQNDNLDRVPAVFQDRITKVGFEFCLATIDPYGNPTNGITRTPTNPNNEYFFNADWIYYTTRGGKNIWDAEQYLNIWVTKTKTDSPIGFGSKPYLNSPEEDGVIVASKHFGTLGTAILPFHLGRTTTHEVGHYFNLFHPWGQEFSCDVDDFVADTPLQSVSYSGCPDPTSSSCNSQDITANFMNYGDDDCVAMFTYGQALRMHAALIGARKSLLTSNACGALIPANPNAQISIYPNPASYYFCIEINMEGVDNIPFVLLDTKGAILQEGVVSPNGIQHFPTLQNGLYFIRFLLPNQAAIIKKLVVAQ